MRADPAQVGVGKEPGQLVGVVGAQAGGLEARRTEGAQLRDGDAFGFLGWVVQGYLASEKAIDDLDRDFAALRDLLFGFEDDEAIGAEHRTDHVRALAPGGAGV